MRKVWRCFHCDTVFRNERHAREHFGADQGSLAACQIKGHEHALLRVIREQEEQLARYRSEDGDIVRAMESMRGEHAAALRRAEELGYDRGVQDGKRYALSEANYARRSLSTKG
jgi:transposase